ncbi:MAG: hypothetical protein CMA71_01815 [Euryarchaeota archaeon]|jgi:hypothetical protein|nr:hypothetical protein [Euryarchaeota archaeon]
MGVLRGLSLASIAALPAFILGFIAYAVIASVRGSSIDATEWETWMFLPCYGVPLFCMFIAFIFGTRSSRVDEE